MATVDEILANMTEIEVAEAANEILVIDANTRQVSIPGSELIFGVTSDANAERKYFLCPRYVGNNLDLSSCFIRVNYRNANGVIDAHLITDVAVTDDGENITFSWELHPKVTQYKGQVAFIICACRPNADGTLANEWNTTLSTGIVLEGLEPTNVDVAGATTDVIAQLLAMVEKQTEAVENVGETQVAAVNAEGATQVQAVKTAAETAEAAAVAEIEAKGVNVRESIPDDYTALSEAVDGLTRSRAGAIVCEAEGSAIAVNDASDMRIQGLRIFGRSTLDGVPTPDSPVEIVSVDKPVVTVCGKNLLDVKNGGTKIGVTETVTSGRVTFSGTAEGSGGRTAWKRSDVVTLPPGTYRMSMIVPKGKAPQPCLTINGTTTVLASDTNSFTVTEPTSAYLGFNYDAGVSYDAENVAVQLEVGKIATAYEPYKHIQTVELTHTLPGIPVTSGGNYTDSDGQQWICDEVDFERGVYVQRIRERSFVGTETYSDYVSYDNVISTSVWHMPNTPFFCSHAKENEGVKWANDRNISFNASHFSVSSAEEFKALLTEWNTDGKPLTVVYVPTEPIETPLSETEIAAYRALHSNYPNTTVLNDAGAHMVVKYAADTKLYIDNKIAAMIGG
jgi:hypothetical protein